MIEDKRKNIDLLVEQFWKQGYLTLSRRFGTYLPEPSRVGNFEVDVIARHKKNYAIGITLNDEDFKDPGMIERITYLATRQTSFSNKRVFLFVGVKPEKYKTAKALIDSIPQEIRKNIKIFPIAEHSITNKRRQQQRNFFS